MADLPRFHDSTLPRSVPNTPTGRRSSVGRWGCPYLYLQLVKEITQSPQADPEVGFLLRSMRWDRIGDLKRYLLETKGTPGWELIAEHLKPDHPEAHNRLQNLWKGHETQFSPAWVQLLCVLSTISRTTFDAFLAGHAPSTLQHNPRPRVRPLDVELLQFLPQVNN